jgi:hypothetical protein
MLPRVNDELLEAGLHAGAIDGSELGKVRPSADDVKKTH